MKTVLRNHQEVCHVWAQRKQEHGRANNIFFEDTDCLYSYGRHFLMARFIESKKAGTVVLFNNASYSNSTAKHQNYALSAIDNSRYKIFTVPVIPKHTNELDAEAHKLNYIHYVQSIENLIDKASRARIHGKMYLSMARDLILKMGDYIKAFGLDRRTFKLYTVDDNFLALTEIAKQRYKKHQEQQKILVAKRKTEAFEKLRKWVAGEEGFRHIHNFSMVAKVYLRVKDDEIQTSHGASVPVKTMSRLFPLIVSARANGQDVIFNNGDRPKAGHYRIDNIYANGNIKAGCHLIQFDEIERIAKQLNIA